MTDPIQVTDPIQAQPDVTQTVRVLAPPKPLLVLLLLSLFGSFMTLGYSYRYTLMWQRERAGKSIEEQRETMKIAQFSRDFTVFTARLREKLPAGTRIFYEPLRFDVKEDTARWFLYLTYYLHPLQIYVRKNQWAAGTLVDVPKWSLYHRSVRRLQDPELHAIVELGIQWRIRLPVVAGKVFPGSDARLDRLIDGDWVSWDLDTWERTRK